MYILLVLQNVLTSGFSKCTYFWFCKMYILLLYTILDCNMYLLLMYTILVFQNVHTSDVHNSAPPDKQASSQEKAKFQAVDVGQVRKFRIGFREKLPTWVPTTNFSLNQISLRTMSATVLLSLAPAMLLATQL